ncbi:MAG: alkaline phosphatase family protein [Planctomycetes bacterium]|nr:alkaline phosphatase family protein [Planctomycetota bacterium]
MPEYVVLLSVPGLRRQDLEKMPRLRSLVAEGDRAELVASFPAVTCPVQANMTTGAPPSEHGVVANGFYWRDQQEVEMWTSTNGCVQSPQLWDIMHRHNSSLTTAAWFPLHSKECGADYVCTPAPIHHADGSESMWCYTRPEEFYQEMIDELGQFPLQHFWGPMANIKSTAWIVDSAIRAARQYRPNLFYIYLPHLDYAAQKLGPDSEGATLALADLDAVLGKLIDGFASAYGDAQPLWLVASEYVITAVDHVSYPNRVLREAGLLAVREESDGEHLDFSASRAWAMVDHQFSHVFVRDSDAATIEQAKKLLASEAGVAEVLTRKETARYDLEHELCGDLVVISKPNSWQAYYWWLDDARAPSFARSVDIHSKPGYDPVELFWDQSAGGVPLDASLVKGSHGAPTVEPSQRGVLFSSQRGVFVERPMADTDVADIVLRQFGI